jgi:hypothetical protein
MPPAGFETAIPADPRIRTRGYWGRQLCVCVCVSTEHLIYEFCVILTINNGYCIKTNLSLFTLETNIIFCDAGTQVVANCSSSKRNN